MDVTTRSYSNLRDGAQLGEVALTALAVQRQGLAHLFDCMLPGDLRGTEGQPLIVTGLIMGDGEMHNVLFVASMSNDVRAFDADAPNAETGQGQILWERRVGNPIKGTLAMDMFLINDFWGILSTPVIDIATGTLWCVSMSSLDGLIGDSTFTLHGLSLIDGSDMVPPLNLNEATVTQIGADGASHTSSMGMVPRKQRCGLALATVDGVKLVIVANGSFNEDADTNQGWVIACDVTTTPKISASWISSTPPQSGGGIWMGAQAPAVDAEGFIYGMIGNGDFQPPYSFGESFYKLQYTGARAAAAGIEATPAKLEVVQWFTPYTDSGRVGADPTVASAPNDGPDTPGGTSNMDDPGDEDLNSGGALLLPASLTGFANNLILGAGKDGILYVVNADKMGSPPLSLFAQATMEQVYQMLLAPPYGFTYYPGDTDLAPLDTSTIPTTYGGYTHHQHSTPVYYASPRFGHMLFTGGENGPVRAFQLTQPQDGQVGITYLGSGDVVASPGVPPPGGMPGTMMTLSANGTVEDTAVLWCLSPYLNANKEISPGRLVCYGADWVAPGGALVKIWDSADWNVTFSHNKFNVPTVCNGRLYVATYDGRVMVFGLAP
jgi:hypothetical protein